MAKVPFNKPFKAKNAMLNLEDVKVNVKYSFTLNPDDKHQYFNEPIHRLNKVSNFYYLQSLPNYEMYPEISKSGRIHLHGTIWFRTEEQILHFYLFWIPGHMKECTYELDTIEDEGKWREYCSKQPIFHKYFTDHTYMIVPLTKQAVL